MSLPEWIRSFIEPLERADIRYAITGSVASMLYGEIRLTNDVDLLVWVGRESVAALLALYPERDFYVPPLDAALDEHRRGRGGFNVIHHSSGAKADVYFGSHFGIEGWSLHRRRRIDVDGLGLWLLAPEAVIVGKLRFYREGHSPKHLRDIEGILLSTPIETETLAGFIDDEDLRREWSQVQR